MLASQNAGVLPTFSETVVSRSAETAEDYANRFCRLLATYRQAAAEINRGCKRSDPVAVPLQGGGQALEEPSYPCGALALLIAEQAD